MRSESPAEPQMNDTGVSVYFHCRLLETSSKEPKIDAECKDSTKSFQHQRSVEHRGVKIQKK